MALALKEEEEAIQRSGNCGIRIWQRKALQHEDLARESHRDTRSRGRVEGQFDVESNRGVLIATSSENQRGWRLQRKGRPRVFFSGFVFLFLFFG